MLFFFLYSARGGPAGLANKVTSAWGELAGEANLPFSGWGEPGEARFSTADSARCWSGSAPRTAPGSAPRTAPGGWPGSAPRTAPGAGPAQHRGRRWLGSARPASPLCHRHCSGARGRRSRASRTAPSLQRDPAPDIRLASGAEAEDVGLPSGWWGWVGGGRPAASRGFNLRR